MHRSGDQVRSQALLFQPGPIAGNDIARPIRNVGRLCSLLQRYGHIAVSCVSLGTRRPDHRRDAALVLGNPASLVLHAFMQPKRIIRFR